MYSHFADTRPHSSEGQEPYRRPARIRTTGTSTLRRNRLGLNRPTQSQTPDTDVSMATSSPTYERPKTFKGLAESHARPIRLRDGISERQPSHSLSSPAFDQQAEVRKRTSPPTARPAFDEVIEYEETTTDSIMIPAFDEQAEAKESDFPSVTRPAFGQRARFKESTSPSIEPALDHRDEAKRSTSASVIKPAFDHRDAMKKSTSPSLTRLAFDQRAKVKTSYPTVHYSSSSSDGELSPIPLVSPEPAKLDIGGIESDTEPWANFDLPELPNDKDILPEEAALDAMGARLKNSESHMKDAKRLIDRVDRAIVTQPDVSILVTTNESTSPPPPTSSSSNHIATITIPVPRLWRRDSTKLLGIAFTWLGLIIASFIIWYIAESIMCEYFCHPLYTHKVVDWSYSDPFFPYAIPTKLDQWTGEYASTFLCWLGRIIQAAWRAAGMDGGGGGRGRGGRGGRRGGNRAYY